MVSTRVAEVAHPVPRTQPVPAEQRPPRRRPEHAARRRRRAARVKRTHAASSRPARRPRQRRTVVAGLRRRAPVERRRGRVVMAMLGTGSRAVAMMAEVFDVVAGGVASDRGYAGQGDGGVRRRIDARPRVGAVLAERRGHGVVDHGHHGTLNQQRQEAIH